MSTYPVVFAAEYAEPRSRLTTFFRLVLVIPHAVVAFAWSIAAGRTAAGEEGGRLADVGLRPPSCPVVP